MMKRFALIFFLCFCLSFSFLCEADYKDQCGHENGGKICPKDFCCSHEGFCGKGDAYCLDCQNNCPNQTNPKPECGKKNGGKKCPNGKCCSQYGFCGHTESYCDEFCQSGCTKPGNCTVDDHLCGVQNGGRICPKGECCSKGGYCGSTEAYCGKDNCQNNCPNTTNPTPECGRQNRFKVCPKGKCCSQYGFCGVTESYCDINCFCESKCWPLPPSPTPSPSPSPTPTPTPTPPPHPTPTPSPAPCSPGGNDVGSIISKELFEEMLLHRNDDPNCAIGFYTYEGFIEAAKFFPSFGNTGDLDTRKRELAAFFGQTSHETTGGWETAPGGPYTWGYCFKEERNPPSDYCSPSTEWPCAPGKKYYGRGPIQISYNYNYGPCGKAIGYDLLNDPDKVANDIVISFESAIWFWMTPQSPKPSCHDVMTNQWTPSEADTNAGRLPGYGVTTNIINGGLECGKGPDPRVADRIGFYKRYCDILGVSYGDNVDCYNQKPFGPGVRECFGINCIADI